MATVRYTSGLRARGLIFFLYCELFGPHMFKRVLTYFPLPFRLSGGLFFFRVLLMKPSLYVDLLIYMSMFRLWVRGPFPLSAHFGLYKRGRDPLTNPSHHLRKEKEYPPSRVAAHGGSGKESNCCRCHHRMHPCCRRHSLPRQRGCCR